MSARQKLYARVKPLAGEYGMLPSGATVLCCVSGGVDSMCLLHFLRAQSAQWGFTLRACHFDHMARPSSGADAAFVARQCESWGIPLDTTRQDVPAWASEHRVGTEEAGRALRYRWFETLADRYDPCLIATAHQADDNAETLLLHLVRGSGLDGLGGIPPRRGRLVRPFLNVPRSLILDYAAEEAVPFVEDETNADPDYTPRNLLRAQVMPLLRRLNPNLTDTLSAAAASLRQDGAFLNARADHLAQDAATAAGGVVLPLPSVTSQGAAVGVRVLQRAVEKLDPEVVLTAQQRRALLELCLSGDPGGHCDLPHGISAQRVYDTLVFSFPGRVEVLPPTPLDFTGEREIGPWRVAVERKACPEGWRCEGTEFYLSAGEPVLLRPRKSGDTLKLPHRTGTKSLKKWLIELRVPEARRDLVPVLEQGGRCAALYGLGTDEAALPPAGADCLHIIIREKERKIPT